VGPLVTAEGGGVQRPLALIVLGGGVVLMTGVGGTKLCTGAGALIERATLAEGMAALFGAWDGSLPELPLARGGCRPMPPGLKAAVVPLSVVSVGAAVDAGALGFCGGEGVNVEGCCGQRLVAAGDSCIGEGAQSGTAACGAAGEGVYIACGA